MAYTVSSAYHSAIKDGISPQDFMLVDTEAPFNILSSNDGDFVAGSISIVRSVCESTDFTLGECPAATLSASVLNTYGDTAEFWSKRGSDLQKDVWAKAGIGVRLSSAEYTDSSSTLRIALFNDALDMYVTRAGVWVINTPMVTVQDDTLVVDSEYDKMSISGDTIVINGGSYQEVYVDPDGKLFVNSQYATGYSDAVSLHAVPLNSTTYYVYIGRANGTVERMTVEYGGETMPTRVVLSGVSEPSAAMKRKLCEIPQTVVYGTDKFPKTVVRSVNGAFVEEEWEYCPVGVYLLKVPKYSLYSPIITVTDAMDALSLLDTNLKDLAAKNSFSLNDNADSIVTNICTALEIQLKIPYSFSPYACPVTEEMITADITCRQFFKWVGERVGHMWRVDPDGYLTVYTQPAVTENDYTIDDDLLAVGVEVYNEFVDPPEKLLVFYGNDKTYVSEAEEPTSENTYKITGNPLYRELDDSDSGTTQLPWLTYNTLTLRPYQLVTCKVAAADPSFGYGDVIHLDSVESFTSYIMRETLSFGIRVTAQYEATGSKTRLETLSTTYATSRLGSAIPDMVGEVVAGLGLATDESVDNKIVQTLQDALAEGGDINDMINQATEGLISESDVNSLLAEIRSGIVDADTIKEWINQAVNDYKYELQQFLTWSDQYGLTLAALDENGQRAATYLNLMNDRLAFIYGDTMPAWMTANTFNINNLIVNDTASICGLIVQKILINNVTHLRIS